MRIATLMFLPIYGHADATSMYTQACLLASQNLTSLRAQSYESLLTIYCEPTDNILPASLHKPEDCPPPLPNARNSARADVATNTRHVQIEAAEGAYASTSFSAEPEWPTPQ